MLCDPSIETNHPVRSPNHPATILEMIIRVKPKRMVPGMIMIVNNTRYSHGLILYLNNLGVIGVKKMIGGGAEDWWWLWYVVYGL